MMTRVTPAILLFVLAACSPRVPDSAAGVGYQDYYDTSYGASSYGASAAPLASTPSAAAPQFDTNTLAAAIDRADGGAGAATVPSYNSVPMGVIDNTNRPRGNAPSNIREQTGEMAAIAGRAARISDENDFNAVAARETIQSDAERIARNRAEYVVVPPTAMPERPKDTGPNIVQYALSTQHNPGTQIYSRMSLGFRDVNAACAKFASADLAQAEFLRRGGPERDRLGLDPDGDGFVCGWDPRPFRSALQ